MSVTPGTQLGAYEIRSAIGKGGMGEVWEARDTRLGRVVAIKTLPREFATNEERLARFEREAKLLASLNHPNIAAIYGLEQSGDTRFLVMELIEGDTLADVLRRGPIATEQALRLAVQIAEALENAHEKGIVHRDLKPANIKVTPDGKVKVLDFGLAKAFTENESSVNASNSPTLSLAATAQGIILGTAAYMSPEQARGQTADHRADIWSFGCVLYEMLTGRQAFRGEMVSDILASVLARDPDYTLLHAQLHPRLQELVRRCLEKDRKRRWQAIGDVRVEIEQALAAPGGVTAPAASASSAPPSRLRLVLPWIAATLVIAVAATWTLKPAPPPEPRPLVRFEYELTEGQAFRNAGRNVVAFSPDGRHFVYNTARGLFLRSMDSLTARPIPGTEDPLTSPFFSPDGEWVGYFAANELRKIAISGGAPVTLCAATNLFGASWEADGTILFGQPEGIMRVSSDGGKPELVVRTEAKELAYGPQMLPGGKTVLFSVARVEGAGRWDQAQVVVQSLDSGQRKVVLQGGSDARYASTGHLVYALANVLFAVPFDADELAVKGGAVPMIQGVQRAALPGVNTAAANYGLSDRGALVYLAGSADLATPDGVLAVIDRNDVVRRLNVPPAQYRHPRVSPNGRHVAVETVAANGQSTIWVYDLAGSTAIRRLTQEGNSTRPVWTPDSKRITFSSDRDKAQGIYSLPADGSGLPERLTTAEEGVLHFPESWSPDGRVLSFAAVRGGLGGTNWSLWTVSTDSKDKPALFYDIPASNQFGSVFSPDGTWVAYASNEGPDQQFGIYVQPYPPTGVKYQISQTGGAWPVWSPSGGELFYRLNLVSTSVAKLNSVTITTKPVPAFTSEEALKIRDFMVFTNYRDYDIMPNGREFLMEVPANQTASREPDRPRIQAVLNWFEELKTRAPIR